MWGIGGLAGWPMHALCSASKVSRQQMAVSPAMQPPLAATAPRMHSCPAHSVGLPKKFSLSAAASGGGQRWRPRTFNPWGAPEGVCVYNDGRARYAAAVVPQTHS